MAGSCGNAAVGAGPASPREAVEAVCAAMGGRTVGVERVTLVAARGRVLAEEVRADRDSPALDVSAMDGFAMAASELSRGELPIARAEALIGRAPVRLEAGAATRIVTGAPVPIGADVVVKREDVQERDGRVRINREAGALRPGANIRRRGENAQAGDVIVERGRVIDVGVVGAMASFGLAEASVVRRVRVRVITTGDEVMGVGERCEAWQLRDSNGPALHALLAARAWIDSEPAQRVIDDPGAIAEAVRQGVAGADAVILTGGVSMGDRDFVPRVVRELGGRVVFHKLPQRPGRPMLAAVMPSGVPVLGLPGNPVSVLVTARRIGVPVLARLAGIEEYSAGVRRALVEPDGASIDLWWHRLVRERADGGLELVGLKGSGDVAAAAHCSGFVEVPPGGSGAGPWSYFSWDHD